MGRMRSHPLLLKLGKGEAPEMRQSNYEDPVMLELDSGFRDVQHQFGAELYKAADWRCAPGPARQSDAVRSAGGREAARLRWALLRGARPRRPFAWKGEVYLGHWIGFRPAQERMALAVLDEEAGLVRFVRRFSHLPADVEGAQYPSGATPAAKAESASAEAGVEFKREKNWGFVAEGERLLIFYALLPCTVVLEYDAGAPDGVRLADRACFASSAPATLQETGCGSPACCKPHFAAAEAWLLVSMLKAEALPSRVLLQQAAKTYSLSKARSRPAYALFCTPGRERVARHAGLDILRHPMHGSGNPVPWDIERGSGHRELLCMLHVKQGDYAHWAVRIDRATRRVTHVSAGPIVKARDFRNEARPAAARTDLPACVVQGCAPAVATCMTSVLCCSPGAEPARRLRRAS